MVVMSPFSWVGSGYKSLFNVSRQNGAAAWAPFVLPQIDPHTLCHTINIQQNPVFFKVINIKQIPVFFRWSISNKCLLSDQYRTNYCLLSVMNIKQIPVFFTWSIANKFLFFFFKWSISNKFFKQSISNKILSSFNDQYEKKLLSSLSDHYRTNSGTT